MEHEIELINDGDGIAILGEPTVIDKFLRARGIDATNLGLDRLTPTFRTASGIAQAGSDAAAHSGKWVKLTDKSAEALKQSTLIRGSSPGVSRAVLTGEGGTITGILEITSGPGAMLANPALLAGAAGIMAQMAMKHTMDEITDYLASIDAKVDDVLRAQNDAVLADMLGVDYAIEEALTVRDHVGRVSETTWSKVQATSTTVARTQAYALRQLDAIAEKLEHHRSLSNLVDAATDAENSVQQWLAVLARCVQLQDGIAVLELDRVLDASPDERDQHRRALQVARDNRIAHIAASTGTLLERMDAAVSKANDNVLLHPRSARTIVGASSRAATDIVDFRGSIGLHDDNHTIERRRWRDAATDVRDRLITTGSDGLDAAKQIGARGITATRSASGTAAGAVAARLPWRDHNTTTGDGAT